MLWAQDVINPFEIRFDLGEDGASLLVGMARRERVSGNSWKTYVVSAHYRLWSGSERRVPKRFWGCLSGIPPGLAASGMGHGRAQYHRNSCCLQVICVLSELVVADLLLVRRLDVSVRSVCMPACVKLLKPCKQGATSTWLYHPAARPFNMSFGAMVP